jgi:predicted DNA binding CopG/RHH family protein
MKTKPIPTFTSEEEEREFWSDHDATDFIDFSEAKQALMPNLRPTLKTVSIRLPESLLESIRVLAHKRDVPYQSLMKMLLAEGIERELYAQREQ